MSKNHRKTLFCIVTSLYWFSLYSYVPILSPFAKSLDASEKMIGLIVGSYGFTQMVLRIPLGILSDTIKKRKIFVTLGIIFAGISSFGIWLVPNISSLLIFRGLSGVAASTWVSYTVLFTSYYEKEDTTKAIGIINSFNSLGQILAMLTGGLIAQVYGQRFTFLLAAAAAFLGTVLSFGVIENRDIDKKPMKLKDIPNIATDRNLMVVSGLAILSQLLAFATLFGFTPIIAQNLGANNFQLFMLSMLSILPVIIVSPLSGTFFTKKIGSKNTITLGFIISALACACIPYLNNLHTLYITQIIGGFGRGLVFPLLMGLSIRNIDINKRSTAMGFFQAIYGIGMFIGPVMVGFIGDNLGLTFGFLIAGFIGLLGAGISNLLMKG
jgi:MFS family permease